MEGGTGGDRIIGGAENDHISGDPGEDWIEARPQNDEVDGGIGNDTIFGGSGADLIRSDIYQRVGWTYKELGVLDKTMLIVTGLNSGPLTRIFCQGKKVSAGSTTSELDATIPWIAWGANIKEKHPITQPVSLLDTGATIMYALGLDTHTEWDSHAINEIFQSVPERRTTDNDLQKMH